jgi:hypothetical protein
MERTRNEESQTKTKESTAKELSTSGLMGIYLRKFRGLDPRPEGLG